MAMEYHDKHVVVTGGTGALGGAVVAALLEAGAMCHVPYIHEAEAERFPHRRHQRVTLIAGANLADEAAVARLYGGIAPLWASIHIAGGFAMAPITETDKATLTAQLETNLVSCFLCCRGAGPGGGRRRHPRQCRSAVDHGHARQPQGHAEGEFRAVAQGRGSRRDDPVPGLAREQGDARRGRAGLRQIVTAAAHKKGPALGAGPRGCSVACAQSRRCTPMNCRSNKNRLMKLR